MVLKALTITGARMQSRGYCSAVLLFVALGALMAGGCGDPAGKEPSSGRDSVERRDTTAGTGARLIDSQRTTLTVAEPIRKYGVRSGVVEYVNRKLGGQQTFYFDDFGASEAIYLERGTDSTDIPFDVSIYAGTWRIDFNRSDRSGIAKQQPNAPGPALGLLPDLRTVSMTPLEPRTIAGYRATGITFGSPPTNAWMHKGIPLRVERPIRNGADTLILEAVSVRIDEKVPAARFTVPKEIDISRVR